MPTKSLNVGSTDLARYHVDLRAAAEAAIRPALKAGAILYERARDLPRLIRLDPCVGLAGSADATKAIVARLERALRAERCKARSGHWAYDLNRHIALRQAHQAETERLQSFGS
jgi:hypothetical protein